MTPNAVEDLGWADLADADPKAEVEVRTAGEAEAWADGGATICALDGEHLSELQAIHERARAA
jgi:hypothetical protein